uniref:Uncharacterized protein n=1 Tax=Xiphophorus maculatus TaxID=8083 RepID=A0A3B5R1F3_XIPMA
KVCFSSQIPDVLVSKIVSENRGKEMPLPYPDGPKLTVGPVEDTEYHDRPAVVNAWGKFYLPKTTKMEVIGYVEGTSYPCDQLVLMTCEDQKVYGFDGDELHLVASCLNHMFTEGIADPALQSYYHGEPFKDPLAPLDINLIEHLWTTLQSLVWLMLTHLSTKRSKIFKVEVPSPSSLFHLLCSLQLFHKQ